MTGVQLKKLKKLALQIDWQMSFGGSSKGNHHLERAVKIAAFLARAEHADLSIVEPAAWLHDSALPSGNDYEYRKNKKIAMAWLSKLGISKQEASRIAECVASHEGTAVRKTVEAKVVHDADVLEKCGPLGFVRHTWKTVHTTPPPKEHLSKREQGAIMKHVAWRGRQLQTKTARRISVRLGRGISPAIARRIIELTSPLAAKNLITEQIVKKISSELPRAMARRLKQQLSLEYLG